jgi:hypothetical protein
LELARLGRETLMFDAAADFAQTPVSVQTRTGSGSKGAIYAPAVARSCYINDGRKLVRDSAGNEVISETTLFDDPSALALYPAGSFVTVNGRTAVVITAKLQVIGQADVDHLEVVLT